MGGDRLPTFLVALHRAEGETQGKGRVGIVARAFQGEAGFGNFRVGLLLCLALRFHDFSQAPGVAIDESRQFDHRVFRRRHRRRTALVKFLAESHVVDPRSGNELRGAFAGRFAAQDLPHELIRGPHLLGEIRERVGELQLLEIVVNRLLGKELKFQRFTPRFHKFAQPFSVGLGLFICSAQQGAGDAEQIAVKRAGAFEQSVNERVVRNDLLRGRDPIPGIAGVLELLAGRHRVAQFFFRRRLLRHHRRIEQSFQPALVGLAAVLHAEQFFPGPTRILLAATAVGGEQYIEPVQAAQGFWQTIIPHVIQFIHREQTAGAPRVTRHEHQIILHRALGAPLEIMRNLRWLAVLIGPEE